MPVPCHSASQSASARGAATSGSRLRPDCSAAAATICRQCATRFSPRSPSGIGALLAVTSGWIAVAPSSVALRIAESIASLATMPCASVSASGDSRSTGTKRSTRTDAPRLSTRTSVAAYSPPVPSKSVIGSPTARRSTRVAWWAAPASSSTVSPASPGSSGVVHRNRGAAMR